MTIRFEHAYVLDVMSDDHPGIVAAVTTAVESLGGNIDSCSQTVLGGFFTLIMIVSVPEPVEPEGLAERVRRRESGGSPFQVLARGRSDGRTFAVRELGQFCDHRVRQGPAGHRAAVQSVPGRQGYQHC